MPTFETWGDDRKTVVRYGWPAGRVTPMSDIAEDLRSWRRQATLDREEFLGYQKLCRGPEDRELARFFKECAAHQLKLQRACTLMIPWFGEPDTNQEAEPPTMWPVDLAPELDEISGRIELKYG